MNIQKLITILFLFAGCAAYALGMEPQNTGSAADSIVFSQLYTSGKAECPSDFSFKTEEQSVQSHDGQPAFCHKRTVEYKVKNTGSKVTVKRHVVSSETSVLCPDEKVQALYPDVTAQLLSSILKPKKIKVDSQEPFLIRGQVSPAKEGRTFTIDKLMQHPVKDDAFMGVTIHFETATEELVFSTPTGNSLDALQAIRSRIVLDQTGKDGKKHQIELAETITLRF